MTQSVNRRRFLARCSASGVAVFSLPALMREVKADMEALDPSNPQAVALGYVTDATKTDTAKFSRYEAGQECANCQLYQGDADSEAAPCPLFAGKSVAARGWCNSWVPKAS